MNTKVIKGDEKYLLKILEMMRCYVYTETTKFCNKSNNITYIVVQYEDGLPRFFWGGIEQMFKDCDISIF